MKPDFKIHGHIVEDESGNALTGLFVKAYDKDLIFDDMVANAESNKQGDFEMAYSQNDFGELLERKPDLYFVVSSNMATSPFYTTINHVLWNAGKDEHVEIRIPRCKLPSEPHAEAISLFDAQGQAQSEFEVGASLLISTQGLLPNCSYGFQLLDEPGDEILSISLVANRFGVIAPTVVWPDIGIGNPELGGRYAFETDEQAVKHIGGQKLTLRMEYKQQTIHQVSVPIKKTRDSRRLFPSSKSGTLQRGFILGEDDLRVEGYQFPANSVVDLYLVRRQSSWKIADPITPARNVEGQEIIETVQVNNTNSFSKVLAPARQLFPGAYDIIARVTQNNEYHRNERVLRATDFVSERLITTVVVRDDVFRYKPVKMGCVMAHDVAGKMLWGVPEEIEYTNNFPVGTDVWAALDPAGLMPEAFGKKVRYYVVQHKTAAQWSIDDSLTNVTGTVTEVITSPSCVNANAALVWSHPMLPGQYDLVVDFGNNAPDPAAFISDSEFNPPLDMIDGYFSVGFYVSEDPSIAGLYAVGATTINEPAVTIPATGVWAPWGDGIRGDTPSGNLSLPLNSIVRYPADVGGTNVAVSISKSNYPLVVIMHGMHTTADPSYLGYNYLLNHLASHGFIAVSIDCNAINAIDGMQDTRAHAILEHLSLLNTKNSNPGLFFGKIDTNRIGIMGHSRGGDGVVQAEILNQSLSLGWNIKAIVALSPTDFSGTSSSPLNLTTSKFMCIYGANDGDVWGGTNPGTQYAGTGFRFYDRANVEKSVQFIYGATHNRFNTEWGTESAVDSGSPKILSNSQHHSLLCGYMTAFMQVHLQDKPEQRDYINGVLKIPSVSSVAVHCQYRPESVLTLDNYESAPALNQNTLGGSVSHTNLNGLPEENTLVTLDTHSPHQTRGLRLRWNSTAANYVSQIPVSNRNISGAGYQFFSFRVSQKAESAFNPVNQLRDLRVRLTTGGGGASRAIRAGYFDTIPYPYKPEYITAYDGNEEPNTKSALKTVLIPLYAWTIKCLSVPIVDLTNIESVSFEFDYDHTGELDIDEIEFTE